MNSDLTRGTNKFDGTPIRNSPCLSDGQDLIRQNVLRSIERDVKRIKGIKYVKGTKIEIISYTRKIEI